MPENERKALVFQSDFGISDGAVSAMYGVAYSVDPFLKIFDLTHDIPQYNVWEASYRLIQTVQFWPVGTVFVSVVDPGVGSTRRSVAVETQTGQIIVTPDNGTVTHIIRMLGVRQARLIVEAESHSPFVELSYTFHGRDVYAYVGARLAAGVSRLDEIGPELDIDSLVQLNVVPAERSGDSVSGTIDVLDVRFGSLWTNIPLDLFKTLNITVGNRVEVDIQHDTRTVYKNFLVYAKSFADVNVGESLVYLNSLSNMAVAINQGSFAQAYNIGTGTNWQIAMRKAPRLVYE
ncbi:MAG: S-adenosyl-l-methionine hydroxide adenosyltransferase family protein [Eubacteriales bacterium]|nr:S-adenosyl-l-methionine hydroxide adenosyltransferase family protein [Eubacteriales bacterium]MDD4462544.1 S-adenosyl-l-methionine hydroxide adenosyltransferase family protein [Eubacteriales bacterium]